MTEERGGRGGVESRGLQLLLQCTEAAAMDHLVEAYDLLPEDHLVEAYDLLPEISKLASPFGSSLEHVAAYFNEALCDRIVSSFLDTYSLSFSDPQTLSKANESSRPTILSPPSSNSLTSLPTRPSSMRLIVRIGST